MSTGLKPSGFKITGVVTVSIAALTFLGGVFNYGYSQLTSIQVMTQENKAYTDQNIKEVRKDMAVSIADIQKDVAEVKKDTAVVRAILEERYSKKK